MIEEDRNGKKGGELKIKEESEFEQQGREEKRKTTWRRCRRTGGNKEERSSDFQVSISPLSNPTLSPEDICIHYQRYDILVIFRKLRREISKDYASLTHYQQVESTCPSNSKVSLKTFISEFTLLILLITNKNVWADNNWQFNHNFHRNNLTSKIL